MINKEKIVAEIEKLPEEYLEEIYKIIKDFGVEKEQETKSDQSVMSKLRRIKISASSDFSMKAKLYDYDIEGKNAK